MENILVFVSVIAGVIFLSGLLFFVTRRTPEKGDESAADYAAGLNYLVSGDLTMALTKLKDAVKKNTENIDAYIRIGDILRDAGHVDQAIKVHRDLTARTNLDISSQLLILRSLETDFEKKGSYPSALKVIERIYSFKKGDLWAQERELLIYEKMKNWKKAEEVYRRVAKQKNKIDNERLASYCLERGRVLRSQEKAKDARDAFREAIKIDKSYFPAYAELSDAYQSEKREPDALETLKRFVRDNPDAAAHAFERIKELLFRIGEFGEIENVYLQVIEGSPENWDAYLALAQVKDKKGEIDDAIDLCKQVLQKNPDYAKAREFLVRYYHRCGKDDLAVEQALAIINADS